MSDILLTIITCTYNRGIFLPRIFKCLESQSNFSFHWLIIDDGSTDNTENIVNSFKSNKFEINYHKKKNGGKHTAINYAIPFLKGKLVLFLDSDDYLTKDAVEIITSDWKKYSNDKDIAGISYIKTTPHGRNLSKNPPKEFYCSDYISYRVNQSIHGDQCEVIRADLLQKYPFPIFPDEKFLSESWLWFRIAEDYKMMYRSKSIYMAEYLSGGLTKSGKSLILNNPIGGMMIYKMFFQPNISINARIRKTILFDVCLLCSKKNYFQNIFSSNNVLLCISMLPIAFIFYLIWRNQK